MNTYDVIYIGDIAFVYVNQLLISWFCCSILVNFYGLDSIGKRWV